MGGGLLDVQPDPAPASVRPVEPPPDRGTGFERHRRIILLALPIIGGMISQNVVNVVDNIMVGSLGDPALAAVGVGGAANFMAIAAVMGLSAGVQAVAARRYGEGETGSMALPLNSGLLLALLIGVPLSVGLYLVAPTIVRLMVSSAEVSELMVDYWRARLVSVVAVGVNFSFRGYWNAVDLPRLYLRTLVFMHVLNVIVSYVLIFGAFGVPAYGVLGAGIGTSVSMWAGTLYYFYLGFRHARAAGFLRATPSGETLRTVLRVAGPACLQQFLFATGMTVLMGIIERIGTAEAAASSVLIQLYLLGLLPALAFGIASASLVGQALGRNDPADAKRWAWDVSQVAFVSIAALALVVVVFTDPILSAFFLDRGTVELARPALRLLCGAMVIDAIGMVLMSSLQGAGDTKSTAVVTIGVQWVFILPSVYVLGLHYGLGLMAVWAAYSAFRFVQTGLFMALWRRGAWARVTV